MAASTVPLNLRTFFVFLQKVEKAFIQQTTLFCCKLNGLCSASPHASRYPQMPWLMMTFKVNILGCCLKISVHVLWFFCTLLLLHVHALFCFVFFLVEVLFQLIASTFACVYLSVMCKLTWYTGTILIFITIHTKLVLSDIVLVSLNPTCSK